MEQQGKKTFNFADKGHLKLRLQSLTKNTEMEDQSTAQSTKKV